MAKDTQEIHLEEHIVKFLVENGGFHEVSPAAYDKELCLIPSEVIAFLQETQADKYNLPKLDQYGDKVDEKLAATAAKTYIDHKDKTLDLLQNKVNARGGQLDRVYWQPLKN